MTLADRLRAALDPARDHPPASGHRPAAVLLAITDRPTPGLILTVRCEGLRAHAGQIAFPGGRIDPDDADAAAAALREAHEELGIDPAAVEVAGTGQPYRTTSGYEVVPVVGVIPPDLAITANPAEVADWFEAPLGHLLDPANHRLRDGRAEGRSRDYYEVRWKERRIWGATAAMLVALSARLQWR